MSGNSRSIISTQTGKHPDLEWRVCRYRNSCFQRPVSEHALRAMEILKTAIKIEKRPLLLDSCCGTGHSSRMLAKRYPGHFIIGVDRSEARLRRGENKDGCHEFVGDNLLFLRTNLLDFYPMMLTDGLRLSRHTVFYPNPYPKSEHLKRRWHASPVFPSMVGLGGQFEVRSNWQTYLDEMAYALSLYGVNSVIDEVFGVPPVSLFEKKYAASGQKLFRLQANLDEAIDQLACV